MVCLNSKQAYKRDMPGPQYKTDAQKFYNYLTGILRGYPLKVEVMYLNYFHRYLRVVLRKYMKSYHHHLMSQYSNRKLPNHKFHNYRCRLGLRYHMFTQKDICSLLEVSVVPLSEEEKFLHPIEIIYNQRLSKDTVFRIFASTIFWETSGI